MKAGVPLEQVWELATRKAGDSFNVKDLGMLRAGAPADFLQFTQDPTLDFEAFSSLQSVVSQGKLYPFQSIQDKIAEYQAHYRGFLFDRLSQILARLALLRLMRN